MRTTIFALLFCAIQSAAFAQTTEQALGWCRPVAMAHLANEQLALMSQEEREWQLQDARAALESAKRIRSDSHPDIVRLERKIQALLPVAAPKTFESGQCQGAFAVIHSLASKQGQLPGVCAPADDTRGHKVAIFVAFSERNPARFQEPFMNLVLDALREAFPCRR